MIFFEKQIEPFFTTKENRISSIPCELLDGRVGYYLGDDKKEVIESKGATVEQITREQIKTETDLI